MDDGNIPIDDGATERAIRPFTIGRNNWIACDSIVGAEAAAIMYTIVETAKATPKVYYLFFIVAVIAAILLLLSSLLSVFLLEYPKAIPKHIPIERPIGIHNPILFVAAPIAFRWIP